MKTNHLDSPNKNLIIDPTQAHGQLRIPKNTDDIEGYIKRKIYAAGEQVPFDHKIVYTIDGDIIIFNVVEIDG